VFTIHVENLVKAYDSRRVLDGVNLDVAEGEFYALMGPNGRARLHWYSFILKTRLEGRVTNQVL